MIKNNSIELAAYVSPAIKIAQIKARRVMCQSPGQLGYGRDGEAGQDGDYTDDDKWSF